jgi:hypothetical protein
MFWKNREGIDIVLRDTNTMKRLEDGAVAFIQKP